MPVTMEQRQEIRKSQVAVVVVLDRSGSMSMTIHDGRTKMDLANLGTAEVFKLLAPTDFFSAIAVDSTPHIVIPLSPVSTQPNAERAIRGIRSMGGGIYVYTGLEAAVEYDYGATDLLHTNKNEYGYTERCNNSHYIGVSIGYTIDLNKKVQNKKD